MLLGPKDGARPSNSDPANEKGGREFIMFHGIATDQGARATQARFTVHGEDAWVPLAHLQEFLYDSVGRRGAVNEEHVRVVDAGLGEFGPIVLRLVQAHHMSHTEVPEHLQVVLWTVASTIWAHLVHRAHERNELARQHPVEVPILHFLVIFILFVVELPKVVPAETHTDFEALQAVEDGAAVGAVAVAGVAKRPETSLIRSEGLPSDLGRLAQNHNHESAHQIGSIRLLVVLVRSVVEEFDIFVALICKHSAQLSNELVRGGEVQWAKV